MDYLYVRMLLAFYVIFKKSNSQLIWECSNLSSKQAKKIFNSPLLWSYVSEMHYSNQLGGFDIVCNGGPQFISSEQFH